MQVKNAIPVGQIRAVLIGSAYAIIQLGMGAVGPGDLVAADAFHGREGAVMVIAVRRAAAAVVGEGVFRGMIMEGVMHCFILLSLCGIAALPGRAPPGSGLFAAGCL